MLLNLGASATLFYLMTPMPISCLEIVLIARNRIFQFPLHNSGELGIQTASNV